MPTPALGLYGSVNSGGTPDGHARCTSNYLYRGVYINIRVYNGTPPYTRNTLPYVSIFNNNTYVSGAQPFLFFGNWGVYAARIIYTYVRRRRRRSTAVTDTRL